MKRITRAAALAAAVLATSATPALAASPSEEAEARDAVYQQIAQEASTKLGEVRDALELLPAAGTKVSAADGILAQVYNGGQLTEPLTGAIFMDRFADAGRLDAKFSVSFAALPVNSSVALDSKRAAKTSVTGFTDRVTFALRPPFFPDGGTAPAALTRRLKADVKITVDPPKLGELVTRIAGELNLPVPQNMAQLARFIDDRLTPAGYTGPDVLCKHYEPTDPAFCGSLVPAPDDDDPNDTRLFTQVKEIDVLPADTLNGRPLFTSVEVLPVAVPAVSAWFRHPSFATSDPQGAGWCPNRTFALLAVPDFTPGLSADPVAAGADLRAKLGVLERALNGLSKLSGLSTINTQIDTLISRLNLVDPRETRAWKGNADNLNADDFQMIGNGRCTSINDIEANNEISSMSLFGLPGASVAAFTGRSGAGSQLTTTLPSTSTTSWMTSRPMLDDFDNAISSIRPAGAGNPQ